MGTRSESVQQRIAEAKLVFLEELRLRGVVVDACILCGYDRRQVYRWRETDTEFADAWDAAVDDAVDGMEREAYRRAVVGVEEPVFYKGDECGYIQRYSDSLLTTLLKAHRPEKYRERVELSGTVDVGARILDARKRAGVK